MAPPPQQQQQPPPPPQKPNLARKAKNAVYSTLVFFLNANPQTIKKKQSVIGGWLFTIADAGGCPTAGGYFLHTTLFFFVLWGAMLFPRDPV